MTCKDCIHYEPCFSGGVSMWNNIEQTKEDYCSHFKNKADFAEVVRCKDCAHYIEMKGFDYNGRKARSCVWHSALRGENDYCSDAIRISKRTPKEGGGEK